MMTDVFGRSKLLEGKLWRRKTFGGDDFGGGNFGWNILDGEFGGLYTPKFVETG